MSIDSAKIALEKFNKMVPMMSSFASALAHRPLVVEAGASTETDGRKVFVRVPPELAKGEAHITRLCDQRDADTWENLCPACASRESVVALLFHEMSHVIFKSFEAVGSSHYAGKGKNGDAIRAFLGTTRGRSLPQDIAESYGELHSIVLRVMEDLRVDSAMRDARPGTHASQRALLGRSLRDETGPWRNAGPNDQAVIAPLVATLAPEMLDDFHPYVAASVLDDEVSEILWRVAEGDSVADSLVGALDYIDAMKKRGFFEEEKEEDPDGGEGDGEGKPGEASGAEDGDDSSARSSDGGGGGAGSTGGSEAAPTPPESGDSDGGTESEGDMSNAGAGDGDGGSSVRSDGGEESTGSGSKDGDDDSAESSDDESDGDEGGAQEEFGDHGNPGGLGEEAPPKDGRTDGTSEESEEAGGSEDDVRPPDSFGDPSSELIKEILEGISGHGERGEAVAADDAPPPFSEKEIKAVIATAEHFDTPSKALTKVRVDKKAARPETKIVPTPESVLGPATLRMRAAFEENRRAKYDRNRKSGRVSPRVLGRRAWNDDGRLFQRKTIPGKRDYAVLIGVDASGSTGRHVGSSTIIKLEVQAALAQAELCHRVGVKFAVYAHSGDTSSLYIRDIKSFDAPWNDEAKRRLLEVKDMQANYDGHTLEFYRKELDRVYATDKVLMYYSDGAMPAENYDEELALLKREIEVCRKRGYVLLAVGAHSEEPKDYGMDTVLLETLGDVSRVVEHLGRRLIEL